MKMTRRRAGRLILAAPLAAAAAGAIGGAAARAAGEPAPGAKTSSLGAFLAGEEPGLDETQRAQVEKDVAQLEQALATIRDFRLANDVPPAGTFMALRSKRP